MCSGANSKNNISTARVVPRSLRHFVLFDGFLLVLLFASVLAPRVVFFDTKITPDSRHFIRIAENIVLHHCYSGDEPSSGDCTPAWGSQPPAYPLLIAAIKYTTGDNPSYIVFAQSLLFAIAACYALWAVFLTLNRSRSVLVLGILLSVSPLSLAWSSWILTETLSAAAALWLFAELIQSIFKHRLRWLPISVSYSVAILVRWDLIWLFVPIVVCALYVNPPAVALRLLLRIGLFAAAPYAILILRAMMMGLPLIPQPHMGAASDPWLPSGVVETFKATAVNQNAASTFLWPIWSRQYDTVLRHNDYGVFVGNIDKEALPPLINAVQELQNNTPFPEELNQAFSDFAQSYKKDHLFYSHIAIPLFRFMHIWTDTDLIAYSGWAPYSFREQLEALSRAHKVLLLISLVGMLFIGRRRTSLYPAIVGLLCFIFLRTAFLVSAPVSAFEIRYLTAFFPLMEIFLIAVLSFLLKPIVRRHMQIP